MSRDQDDKFKFGADGLVHQYRYLDNTGRYHLMASYTLKEALSAPGLSPKMKAKIQKKLQAQA